MKRIHTLLGCAVVVVGMSVLPAVAQDQPDLSGPPAQQQDNGQGQRGGRQFNGDLAKRPGGQLMQILHKLNLTDDQKAKVHEILKANATNMAEHRKAMQQAMEEMRAAEQSKDQDKIKAAREKLKQLRDGSREQVIQQVSTVLTADQQAKLKELVQQQMKEREGKGGPDGRRDGPLEKLRQELAKLNLTAEQKTQIEQIIQTHKQAMEQYMSQHKDEFEQLRKKMRDAMHSKDRQAMQAAREQMRKLMEASPANPKDLIEQISKVLTEEQAKQLKQNLRQMREHRGPEGGPGGRGEGMEGGRRGRPGSDKGGQDAPPPPDGQLNL